MDAVKLNDDAAIVRGAYIDDLYAEGGNVGASR